MFKKLTILLIFLKTFYCEDNVDFVNIILNQGVVSGKVEKTFLNGQNYIAFRGIPYAKPPLGELRFLPPKPHEGWEGTYEAHDTKETCLQYSGRMRNSEPYGISGSEDCLYISVYTPSTKDSMPVIVFDYNDHFRTSFNGTKTYAPDFFMESNVVIVTISHRLGVFGYLSTEDDVLPGNAGLKDYILGLKWIRDNIEHFGGNPNKVTLMGNRGGAAIADILLYSENAKGLFGGVILQSGTSIEPIYFPSNPREKALALAKTMNILTDNSEMLLKELREIDAKEFLLKEPEIVDSEEMTLNQISVLMFSPIIEHDHPDAVLVSLPDHSKVINDVPIMIGYNSREGLDLCSHYVFEPRILIETEKEFLLHFPIRSGFKFDKVSSLYAQAKREIKDFYFKDGEFTVYNILEYAIYIGDMLQLYASDYAVRKFVKDISSPVFYYMFDFRGALNENMEYISRSARSSVGFWGATITDELCYLFLCERIHKKYIEINELPSEQREMKILKKMVRMWTNFAITRNPTPKGDKILQGLNWEPVNKNESDKKYLHISKKLQMKANPLAKRIKFWDEFLSKYSQMAVDGVVSDHDEL